MKRVILRVVTSQKQYVLYKLLQAIYIYHVPVVGRSLTLYMYILKKAVAREKEVPSVTQMVIKTFISSSDLLAFSHDLMQTCLNTAWLRRKTPAVLLARPCLGRVPAVVSLSRPPGHEEESHGS